MPVRVSTFRSCNTCSHLIRKTWNFQGDVQIIICRNEKHDTEERRYFEPHDKCWCPRWEQEINNGINN